MHAKIRICSLHYEAVSDPTISLRVELMESSLSGGGGTFGVVLESTVKASPQVTIQAAFLTFTTPNETITKELWSTMAANGLRWGGEGWGGIATSQIAIYINPKLNKEEATKSMTPLIEFGKRIKKEHGEKAAIVSITEYPSWAAYFEWFANANVAVSGVLSVLRISHAAGRLRAPNLP